MSIPPQPPYVPTPAPRRGPGCWMIGGLTCLVVFVLVAVVFFLGFFAALRSPGGKKLMSSVHKMIHAAGMMPDCEKNMLAIQAAVLRYHEHTGHYPGSLKQLLPDYLVDPSVLHCALDPDPDPSHITYNYIKPTESAPASAPLLTLFVHIVVDDGQQKQMTTEAITVTLGGAVLAKQSRPEILPASPHS